MSEEIEIEYKAMLQKEQFEAILAAYPFPNEAIVQTNHYFETDDFALREANAALRIREISENYVITLKQAKTNHVLETHDTITAKMFTAWTKGEIIYPPAINKALTELGIESANLTYVGALTTKRYTFEKDKVHYCLDESHYAGITDYELEIEESTFGSAIDIFLKIIGEFAIEEVVSETKIARFFAAIGKNR